MSASLVGSEMCIRDRSTTPTSRKRVNEGPPIQPQLRRVPKLNCITPSGACLLYTSDAADDM
eukprot:5852422-Alexandrium_andersonii.AAC.1